MPKDTAHVTDAELAVLDVLWRDGPRTIREITAALYPEQTPSDYATVQKLLERLEAKRCVARDRTGFAHVFAAAVERGDLIGSRLAELAAKLGDGSVTSLLAQLVEGRRLSSKEREALRRLLDEAEERG
jgi:predicted transcriptional regulator